MCTKDLGKSFLLGLDIQYGISYNASMRQSYPFKKAVQQRYANGEHYMALCQEYSIGTSTMARWIKELTSRDLKGKAHILRALTEADEVAICTKYQDGKTSDALAIEYTCAGRTILNTLKRYGIKVRRRGVKELDATALKKLREGAVRYWEANRDEAIKRIYKNGFGRFGGSGIDSVTLQQYPEYKALRTMVFQRDGYLCIRCGSGKRLHCHHKVSLKNDFSKAFDPDNCETLCNSCHIREEAYRKYRNNPYK